MSGNDPNANRPGFKETKVGWIPEEWGSQQLSDLIAQPISGYSANSNDIERDGNAPAVMKLSCIADGLFRSDANKAVTDETEVEKLSCPVQKDSLVISRANTIELVGAVAFVPEDHENLFLSDLMWKLLPRGMSSVSMRWLGYLLNSAHIHSRIASRSSGTSGSMRKITKPSLLSIWVPTPEVSEQKKIAEILSTCDEAIEKVGGLIEAKKRQKRALMQQLLTGRKRLPGFEREWERIEMGELMREVSRPVEWGDDALYRLISVRRRSGGLFFRESLYGREIKTKVMNTTEKGDFLISKMQVVHGAMAMTTVEFDGGHVSGSYITLVARDPEDFHMPFFDLLSRTDRLYHLAFISSYGVVIEKMTFNLKDFLKKKIIIPPTVEEQKEISAVINAAGEEIVVLNDKLAALKQQKKALMQKLLTGQIRVKL